MTWEIYLYQRLTSFPCPVFSTLCPWVPLPAMPETTLPAITKDTVLLMQCHLDSSYLTSMAWPCLLPPTSKHSFSLACATLSQDSTSLSMAPLSNILLKFFYTHLKSWCPLGFALSHPPVSYILSLGRFAIQLHGVNFSLYAVSQESSHFSSSVPCSWNTRKTNTLLNMSTGYLKSTSFSIYSKQKCILSPRKPILLAGLPQSPLSSLRQGLRNDLGPHTHSPARACSP